MKYTNSMEVNGELACRSLSSKALNIYESTDPFKVYEYEEDGEKRYAYDGCLGSSEGMTFDELQSNLEAIADEIEEE